VDEQDKLPITNGSIVYSTFIFGSVNSNVFIGRHRKRTHGKQWNVHLNIQFEVRRSFVYLFSIRCRTQWNYTRSIHVVLDFPENRNICTRFQCDSVNCDCPVVIIDFLWRIERVAQVELDIVRCCRQTKQLVDTIVVCSFAFTWFHMCSNVCRLFDRFDVIPTHHQWLTRINDEHEWHRWCRYLRCRTFVRCSAVF
jgi:hypothetical protein